MTNSKKWNWLGDHLAVDLANTVRRYGDRTRELLETPDDLVQWLEAERYRVPVPSHVDGEVLGQFISLRDSCLQLLDAAYAGRNLPEGAVRQVNKVVTRYPIPRVLTAGGSRVTALPAGSDDPGSGLYATLAAAIVDLLAADDLHGIAFCQAPSCGQYFHRQRPNQTWCCPTCGDRVRSARYYRRGKAQR